MRSLLPLVLVAAACGPNTEDTRTARLDADPLERVDIRMDVGSVRVVGTLDQEPAAEAALAWRGDTAPEFETRLAGRTAILYAHCPDEVAACRIDLDVFVPPSVDVDIDALSADVSVDGIDGVLDVVVTEGDVTLSDLSGNTRADVAEGAVSFTGTSGRMDLRVPEGTVEGTEVASPTVKLRGDRRDVSMTFAQAPDLVEVDTTAGNIDLVVPRGEYDMITHSDRGDVEYSEITNTASAPSVMILESVRGDIRVVGK